MSTMLWALQFYVGFSDLGTNLKLLTPRNFFFFESPKVMLYAEYLSASFSQEN
jgi:hypothetical protein